MPGKAGCRHRGSETGIAAFSSALRPHEPAARSERPLRLLGQDHARTGAGPVRKAQGPHLSADGFSRAARGLSRHGEEDPRHVRGAEIGLHAPRSSDTEERLGQAEQAHIRQQKDLRPFRDHPDDAETRASLRGGREALRFGREALSRRVLRVVRRYFDAAGHAMTQAGWLEVYGKEAETGESSSLVAIKDGEKVRAREVEVRANQTKPPARFTEATLLSAMEGAGKLVEDEELREAMSEKGLGTPATRAQIIEGLIYED